jgi:hypothetical protein
MNSAFKMASAPTLGFDHFPPEVRIMIFKEVMVKKQDALNLVAALWPLHRNVTSSLYSEALKINYALHSCTIRDKNMDHVEKLGETAKASVQNLVVEFT